MKTDRRMVIVMKIILLYSFNLFIFSGLADLSDEALTLFLRVSREIAACSGTPP